MSDSDAPDTVALNGVLVAEELTEAVFEGPSPPLARAAAALPLPSVDGHARASMARVKKPLLESVMTGSRTEFDRKYGCCFNCVACSAVGLEAVADLDR
jgi:hypothetical protein